MSKTLFKEVNSDIESQLGAEVAEKVWAAYEKFENTLQGTGVEILKLNCIDDLTFPYTAEAFVTMLGKIKKDMTASQNKEAVIAIDNLIQEMNTKAKGEEAVTSYAWYNADESYYESRLKNAMVETRPDQKTSSEPAKSKLEKVIADFIYLNNFDKDIESEFYNMVGYFSNKLLSNQHATGLSDVAAINCMAMCKHKLAAYLDLHTGSRFNIGQPEINLTGNRMLIEMSLYNSFLTGIIGLSKSWVNRIYSLVDKRIVKNSQLDLIFQAVNTEIKKIMTKLTETYLINHSDVAAITADSKEEKKEEQERTEEEKKAFLEDMEDDHISALTMVEASTLQMLYKGKYNKELSAEVLAKLTGLKPEEIK